MSQLIYDMIVNNGHIEIDNLPFPNKSKIKIVVFPEANLKMMSFIKSQNLTKAIKGNLSDDIELERGER